MRDIYEGRGNEAKLELRPRSERPEGRFLFDEEEDLVTLGETVPWRWRCVCFDQTRKCVAVERVFSSPSP